MFLNNENRASWVDSPLPDHQLIVANNYQSDDGGRVSDVNLKLSPALAYV